MYGRSVQMAVKAPMISAIGNKRIQKLSAFSLIEILLVLALMAVASSIVIFNFAAFANKGDSLNTEEILDASIRKGRYLAASTKKIIVLYYEDQTGQLVLSSDNTTLVQFQLDEVFGENGRGSIEFYSVLSSEGMSPIVDPVQSRSQIAAVQFAPDRSSTPFVVEIDEGEGTSKRHVYDPFSSLRKVSSP